MKYCTKCVMPDTRPGITFNHAGVCLACQSYERRKNIDWDSRYKELNTPLLVYGENVSYEYGGPGYVETYSSKEQIDNGVAAGIDIGELIREAGVTREDLDMTLAPTMEELDKLDPMYVSYFIPWNSFRNYSFAKSRGLHDLTHEWDRTHHVENFDQIDSRAYLVHSWLKYPKFGHASATDYSSRMVRFGLITRDEAIHLVKEHDHELDPLCVRDFCDFAGYSEAEFWKIVNGLYNKELFEKIPVADGF